MFSTYLPRSEQDASRGGNAELKRKQNKMNTTMSNQAKSIDKLSSRMDTVEERSNGFSKKFKKVQFKAGHRVAGGYDNP